MTRRIFSSRKIDKIRFFFFSLKFLIEIHIHAWNMAWNFFRKERMLNIERGMKMEINCFEVYTCIQ